MTAPKEYGGEGCRKWPTAKCWKKSGDVARRHPFLLTHITRWGSGRYCCSARTNKTRNGCQIGEPASSSARSRSPKRSRVGCANVQMQARPSEDGSHFILNGEKRYITNAAIANELTVMARTPLPGSESNRCYGLSGDARHAGFRNARSPDAEDGNQGTATGRFALRDVKVPKGKYSRPHQAKV